MDKDRKLRRIIISSESVLNLFRNPQYNEEEKLISVTNYYLEGLPEDTEVESVYYEQAYNSWCMIIKSDSFEEIKKAHIIPIMKFNSNIAMKYGKYKRVEPYVPLL
jgi:hypothetical protein